MESPCGDGQNPTRHGPEQPALDDPALSWEVGLDDLRRCLLTSVISGSGFQHDLLPVNMF